MAGAAFALLPGDKGGDHPAAPLQPPPPTATPIAAETRPAEPKKPARVSLAIAPWGEVVINGEVKGVSPPLDDLELPPGHHEVEIRNGQSEPHRMTLELGPGESYKIKHKFK